MTHSSSMIGAEAAAALDPPEGLQVGHLQPAAVRVRDLLRTRIVKGELAPGERIVERTLCAELNVSRTPMREALKLLERDGLVELTQHRGARVLPFTDSEARYLFEVLEGLEGFAAELAVGRLDAINLAHLEGLHAAMVRAYNNDDKEVYFDLNSSIHAAIVTASDNPVLIATHAGLMLRAKRGRYLAIMDRGRWRQALAEHEALMAVLRCRDAAAAGSIWRQHLRHTGETLADVLRNGASVDGA